MLISGICLLWNKDFEELKCFGIQIERSVMLKSSNAITMKMVVTDESTSFRFGYYYYYIIYFYFLFFGSFQDQFLDFFLLKEKNGVFYIYTNIMNIYKCI